MSYLKNQRGFGAIGYITVVLSLIGVMSMAVSSTAGKSARFRNIESNTAFLIGQVNQIRNALNVCVALYPSGNNGTGFNRKFPGATSPAVAADLTCPGHNSTSNQILRGQTGGLLDPSPNGFGPWMYVNDGSGIYITITSNENDQDAATVLTRIAAKLSGSSITNRTLKIWIQQS